MHLCGISSACFYPAETLSSLQQLGNIYQGNIEIFLNTFSELEEDYLKKLKATADAYSLKVVSVHPFSSGFEPFLFFSDYPTRLQDGIQLYSKFFHACKILGAKILVFHGDTKYRTIDMKLYSERFCYLTQFALQNYGIVLAQENVERCCCGHSDYILQLREYSKDTVSFVLDLKQCRRANLSPFTVLEEMGKENIVHLHLSDATDCEDCLAPGEGYFNFKKLFQSLEICSRETTSVIELYQNNFESPKQLLQGVNTINNLLLNC